MRLTAEHIIKSRAGRTIALGLLLIVLLSLSVRALTAQFLGERLSDAGWFQYGSYKVFDARAQGIMDGKESFFFIPDSTRTDLIQYPPAFPVWVAFIYSVTGERSAHAVLRAHWWMDALLMPLLAVGLGVTAFGWRAGMAAGALVALSPLLAFYGVTPSSDAPTTWLVLAAMWMLLVAAKRQSWRLALLSGLLLGAACWFRVNPLLVVFFWALSLMLFVRAHWRVRARLSIAALAGTLILVAPIPIRNWVVFDEFVLTGLNVGSNFWEGLGETEYGRSLGFEFGDQLMVEQERVALGLPQDFPITPVWPDGIRRDRARARKSLKVIVAHPVWYAGVMLKRMYWMLKMAGEPGPYYGSPGINCTGRKCLPASWQGGITALAVNIIGMIQSVYRYAAIPLAAFGIWLGFRRARVMTILLLTIVFYYLVPGTAAHTEIRYVLPMHGVLVVFAGLAVARLIEAFKSVNKREKVTEQTV
ncbi:MAG TPA: glycosyltransferase family 39 protein [Pyrinomonadaceae bacterium]|nr:glycosyltransferase family 39 protein [Pyrinomonadaceae bacterium]